MKENFSILNKRVMFQDYIAHSDALGNTLKRWHNYSEIWAKVERIKSYEKGGEKDNLHRITIRFNPHIKPSMRIRYQDRILNIVSLVNRDEADRYIVIQTKEAR